MADAPADGEIRAAGTVLWQRSADGIQVALVHRARYDDWSFPKGKQHPGEHVLLTAVREVTEETGVRPILGRPLPPAYYDQDGRPKRVDYWAGRPGLSDSALFRPGSEVDRLEWLSLPEAKGRLSYARDAAVLDAFTAQPADTVPLTFLRHASAGRKGSWPGDDADRPLDQGGAADADRLALLLSCFGSGRVISSATERCMATVRPYAALTGAELETEPVFTVGLADEPVAAAARVTAIAAAGSPAVICAHGENLPSLLAAACAALGVTPPDGPPLPKSGFWVLHAAGGALAGAERHSPGEP